VVDNLLTLTLDANADNIKNIALYRSSNTQASKLIKELPVAGKNYTVSDANVESNTTYIYKAIATDKDGKQNQSNEVSLTRAAGNQVVIYPNPVLTDLTISFDKNLDEVATAKVMDTRGRIINVVSLSAGVKLHNLNLSKLANGNYTISIDNAGVITNIKFSKQ
jgi:Secretion system C-terminal sorting domain